ncbi:hypothetical protein ACHAWF_004010 [Thalassiosira exigua]
MTVPLSGGSDDPTPSATPSSAAPSPPVADADAVSDDEESDFFRLAQSIYHHTLDSSSASTAAVAVAGQSEESRPLMSVPPSGGSDPVEPPPPVAAAVAASDDDGTLPTAEATIASTRRRFHVSTMAIAMPISIRNLWSSASAAVATPLLSAPGSSPRTTTSAGGVIQRTFRADGALSATIATTTGREVVTEYFLVPAGAAGAASAALDRGEPPDRSYLTSVEHRQLPPERGGAGAGSGPRGPATATGMPDRDDDDEEDNDQCKLCCQCVCVVAAVFAGVAIWRSDDWKDSSSSSSWSPPSPSWSSPTPWTPSPHRSPTSRWSPPSWSPPSRPPPTRWTPHWHSPSPPPTISTAPTSSRWPSPVPTVSFDPTTSSRPSRPTSVQCLPTFHDGLSYPSCPGRGFYCDGSTWDCHHTKYCDCPLGQSFCTTKINPCKSHGPAESRISPAPTSSRRPSPVPTVSFDPTTSSRPARDMCYPLSDGSSVPWCHGRKLRCSKHLCHTIFCDCPLGQTFCWEGIDPCNSQGPTESPSGWPSSGAYAPPSQVGELDGDGGRDQGDEGEGKDEGGAKTAIY